MPLKSAHMGGSGVNDSGEASSGLRNRPPGMGPEWRLGREAGDVDRRWWERENGSQPSATAPGSPQAGPDPSPGGGLGPPPPPPPPPVPPLNPDGPSAAAQHPLPTGATVPAAAVPAATARLADGAAAAAQATEAAQALTVQRLELELAAARAEAAALHEMLEDLPEIFERKFRQRLQSTLDQQQRLLADNQVLREQVYTLAPGAPAVETRPSRLLLPASLACLSEPPRRSLLGETLRKVLRMGRPAAP